MPLVRIRRLPVLYWAGALMLSVLTGATVARLIGEADLRARQWGEHVDVPVLVRPVAAGHVLEPTDVAMRSVPRALLPVSPLARRPVGRAVAVRLARGEILLESRMARAGREGPAALLPAGRRGVAVPRGEASLPLSVGDTVDVLATFTTTEDGQAAPTFAVATGAMVIDVGDDQVTLAVTSDEAPRLAFALAQGAVTLALS